MNCQAFLFVFCFDCVFHYFDSIFFVKMTIFQNWAKIDAFSILVENDDSKELEVVDSMKLKCNNDRSWNITEKTKIKTCVCKYIQKL